jgi:hypothetical protein
MSPVAAPKKPGDGWVGRLAASVPTRRGELVGVFETKEGGFFTVVILARGWWLFQLPLIGWALITNMECKIERSRSLILREGTQ